MLLKFKQEVEQAHRQSVVYTYEYVCMYKLGAEYTWDASVANTQA